MFRWWTSSPNRKVGRRRAPSAPPRPSLLDSPHCAVHTLFGPFRVRSYSVALLVQAALGGEIHTPYERRYLARWRPAP